MAFVNRISTAVFDAFFSVMVNWPGWLSLTILSGLTGVIALFAYKYTSNQKAIGKVHDDIQAALLTAKLFKDDIGVTLRAQGKLFGAATRLFFLSMQPLAVMIIPMALLIAQMAPRYEWRPLKAGEVVTLHAQLHDGTAAEVAPISLDVPAGVEIVSGPGRYMGKKYKEYPEFNEVAWKLRVTEPGRHTLTIHVGENTATKELVVSENQQERYCPVRAGSGFLDQVLFAVEPPASSGDTIQTITVEPQPAGKTSICGIELHWIIWWMLLSMVIALIVKPFLNVKMW